MLECYAERIVLKFYKEKEEISKDTKDEKTLKQQQYKKIKGVEIFFCTSFIMVL